MVHSALRYTLVSCPLHCVLGFTLVTNAVFCIDIEPLLATVKNFILIDLTVKIRRGLVSLKGWYSFPLCIGVTSVSSLSECSLVPVFVVGRVGAEHSKAGVQ